VLLLLFLTMLLTLAVPIPALASVEPLITRVVVRNRRSVRLARAVLASPHQLPRPPTV
jgi:hypothetical protein